MVARKKTTVSGPLDGFAQAIDQKRRECLSHIMQVPVAALVWGPNPTSANPVASTRLTLREELRKKGHYAEFSEDLYDSRSPHSLIAQQVAQAEAFDIIFSLPDSIGSVAEIHDFARIPGISHKVVAFVDQLHLNGYSGQSLLATQTNSTCKIEIYDAGKLPNCIIDCALDQVFRMQELLYVSGMRRR